MLKIIYLRIYCLPLKNQILITPYYIINNKFFQKYKFLKYF